MRHGHRADLDIVLTAWLHTHDDGTACVIGDPAFRGVERVRSSTPVLAKGLEFDLVVLVDADADAFGEARAGERVRSHG